MNAKRSVLVGIALIFVWAILAFGAAIPSGWVHVPLGLAVVFLARAVIVGGPDESKDTTP